MAQTFQVVYTLPGLFWALHIQQTYKEKNLKIYERPLLKFDYFRNRGNIEGDFSW